MTAHPPDDALLTEPIRPEVARHLKGCARCRVHRRLLGADAPPVAVSVEGSLGSPLPDDGAGSRWLTWDAEADRCLVWVEPLCDGDPVRLRATADRIAALAHPHLPRIHAVHDGPPLRYARDRLQGQPLSRLEMDRDPRAVAWLAQCASALAVLHDAGAVHGSLGPRAVRITQDGRAHLVDVGLVEGSADGDWRALARMFADVDHPMSAVLTDVRDGRRPGRAVLAWLLAARDTGVDGGSRYLYRGLLGVGGMGEVRRVHDPVLERTVAQKVLSSTLLSDPTRIDRFVDEARITAQLQHPAVVSVHDLEHLPDGSIAFTMQEIEGRTLAQVIREVHAASTAGWQPTPDGWSLRRLVEALRRVCDAIAFAHAQGVVHLDVKPGNVMVGAYGEVLVFDWGLARRLHADGSVRVAQAGGTRGYMAPEQETHGAPVTPAADIYALGMTLRKILDGQVPEDGSSAWVPSRRDAPRELVSIARRATDRDPGRRYPSAQALAADLAAWQDGRQVGAHAYSLQERVARRLRPHQAPIVVSFVAAGVLTAVALASVVRVQGEQERAHGLLAQALVDRANLAWDARDPIRAEAYAAAALGASGRADARGLLARLARGWRPRLLGTWGHRCDELVVVGTPATVVCATASDVQALDVQGAVQWVHPGTVSRLREAGGGGWTAMVQQTVVRGGSTRDEVAVVPAPDGPVVDAVEMPDGRVVVGRTRHVDVPGTDLHVPLDAGLVGMAACGADRLVAVVEGGRLLVLDLQRATSTPLGADRGSAVVTCSPDGRLLAVASDRAVQVWSVDPPMQRHLLVGHLGPVRALDWTPDGRTLASGSADGTVRLWDVRAGQELGRLPGHDDLTDLAFLPDGTGLVTATHQRLRAWALPDRPEVGRFDAVVDIVRLRWSGDGTLFTLDRLGRPVGFDASTGLAEMPVYLRVVDLDGDPSGARVAVVNRAGDVEVLDLEENDFTMRESRAHAGGGTAVAWRPGADLVVSGGAAGDLRAWHVPASGPSERRWALGLGAPIAELHWATEAPVLAARTHEGVVLVDGEQGVERVRFPGAIEAQAIGPDGDAVALAWSRGGLSVGRPPAGGGPRVFDRYDVDGVVASLSFSPVDPSLASVTREGLIQVFDTQDGRELARLFAHPAGATDIGFSRDGRILASSGADGQIVLLDTAPFRAPASELESAIVARYGVRVSGTDLEFR